MASPKIGPQPLCKSLIAIVSHYNVNSMAYSDDAERII
jgi:hypothetical protein